MEISTALRKGFQHMHKRLAMILCGILVLALFSPTALASADVTPPQVLSITSDKSTYQVGDTITVRVAASDTESGLSAEGAMFKLHHAQSHHNIIWLPLSSFDAQSGVYTFTLPVTSAMANGSYVIDTLTIVDAGGNAARTYDYQSLPSFSIAIDNPNQMDCEAPTFDSVTISPDKDLKPGDTMHITVKAHDASGFAYGVFWMRFSDGYLYNNPAWLTQTGTDTLEGDFVIGNSMITGTWRPGDVQLFDNANNMLQLEYTQFSAPTFTVVNVAGADLPPLVTDIKVSSEEVTVGQPVKFTVTVDPRGNSLGEEMHLSVRNPESQDSWSQWVGLTKVTRDKYEGVWQTSPKIPFGEYFVDLMQIWDAQNVQLRLDVDPSLYHFTYKGQTYQRMQRVQVNSIFQGVDNKVLTVGQSFDPLAGITAGGGAEGDLTKAIAVDGTVDTSKPGMYLLRYHVQGATQTWNGNTGKYEPYIYMDFRWIGVSKLPPQADPSVDAPDEVITDDAVDIVLPDSSVQVDVRKDGSPIAYQESNSAEGLYTATVSASSFAGVSPAAMAAPQRVSAAGSGKSMSARVDRQDPDIAYTISSGASSLLLTISAKDPAGIQALKWLPGWVSEADFTDNGTPFTDPLAITANAKYTIYAADRLGNMAIKHVQAVQSPSNYLSGITLSAGTLNRAFNARTTSYTVNLGENDAAVTITPAKAYSGASMTIDGKKGSSKTLSLANGKTATVTIKMIWNKKTTVYKLTIKRAKSTANTLAALTASAGTLSPDFNQGVGSYTLTLPENVSKVALTATRASGLSTVTPAKAKYTLKNGQTVKATFKVKAQSGGTRTYTVLITRAKSTNTSLSFLKVGGGTLTPRFSAGTASYAVTLPAKTAAAVITAKAADPLSKVTINGTKKAALTVKLANGQSATVTVTVVSQAGNSTSYTVVVSRQ